MTCFTHESLQIYVQPCLCINHASGEIPVRVFLLLLEGKAKFKGCTTLHLLSRKALEQASSDVIKRLSAIESVDLRKDAVEFEVAGNS